MTSDQLDTIRATVDKAFKAVWKGEPVEVMHAVAYAAELLDEVERLHKLVPGECVWREGKDHAFWYCSECGLAWTLDDLPSEENINFCPQCGKKIIRGIPFRDMWE